MKPSQWVAVFCVIAAVALAFAGLSGAASIALLLDTGVEIIAAMVTGKQGNETER